MAFTNPNFDGEATFTIQAWLSKEFADLISANNPTFMKMRELGQMKRGGTGTKYLEPVYFPTVTGPQVEDIDNPYDEVEAQLTTGFTSAEFIRCEKEIDISVPLYMIEANDGDAEKMEIVQGITEVNMIKFQENMNANFWAAPDGAQSMGSRTRLASLRTFLNGGNASTTTAGAIPAELATQLGLRAVSSLTGTAAQYTVGNIARNVVAGGYWCPNIYPDPNTPAGGVSLSIPLFDLPYSQAVRGMDAPTLILVTPSTFGKLMNMATFGGTSGGQFLDKNSKMAELGFQALRYRGADIVMDHNVPVGNATGSTRLWQSGTASEWGTALAPANMIYYINTKYLRLRYLSMKPDVRPAPDARPIKRWRARWTGQLTARNLGRVHSVLINAN